MAMGELSFDESSNDSTQLADHVPEDNVKEDALREKQDLKNFNDMNHIRDTSDMEVPSNLKYSMLQNPRILGEKPRVNKHLIPVRLIDENKRDGPWKTIVVVGETGTGKSTTLNSMVNYLFGVRYEDPFRYILVWDGHNADQSKSVTSKVTAYHFKPANAEVEYGVTLVDGPGFNDTDGLSRDEQIWRMYKEYFSNEMSEIDAVCFTMRSTCSRFTPSQKYVYGKILGLFGEDIQKNLFMLMTFCDGKKPPAMHAVKAAKFPCAGRCIKLNNSGFFNGFEHLLVEEDENGEEENGENDDEDEANMLGGMDLSAAFWKIGYEALNIFFTDAMHKVPKTSLALTREVLQEREQLEVVVVGLNKRIREGLDMLECIRLTVKQVKNHQTTLDAHADFKIKVSKPQTEKIDLSGKGIHTTTCLTCNYTCHGRCRFANDAEKAHCSAMNCGKCRVCPLKCSWTEHSNLPFWYKHTTVIVEEVAISKKAAAEAAAAGISNTEAILREKRDKYIAVKMDVLQNIFYVHQIINRLREIALRKDFLDADDHFQAMIESEVQAKQPGFRARVTAIQDVREEAKLVRDACGGGMRNRIENMDMALKKIDEDIQKVSQQYEQSLKKIHKNGGKGKNWRWSPFGW